MVSIQQQRSYSKARQSGAMAAHTYDRWGKLTNMSKRQLAELVCHLAALATDSYDETIASDELLFARVDEELKALHAQKML